MTATCQEPILFLGNFFRQWQSVPDGSVDLAICDPPYNILKRVHAWDERIDFAVLSWILSQLLTPHGQIALFCNGNMLLEVISDFKKYFENRFIEVWHKPSAMALHKDRPKPDAEFVCVFHRRGTKKANRTYNWEGVAIQGKPYTRLNVDRKHTNLRGLKREADTNVSGLRYPSSVVHFPNRPAMTHKEKESAKHPTQKSLDHMKYLIQLLSCEGETVLDPFMGSGTTILAANLTGRKAIGFELLPKYFEMTRTRLEQEASNGTLI